ncbi:MAG TPA: SDR family oxidoreductase [Chthoniobacterales bacterium]|nr:SDR family oxidoreductase [Chthoniobacterales bacterium]
MSKRILVTGATGTVGRDVARLLSKKGAMVRAGVRDQAKARDRFNDDIALVTFDFENEGSFAGALDGVEKVFLLPPLLPSQVEATNALVDSAKRAGVRHLVKLSAIGVDDGTGATVGKWHAANEQHIRDSGLVFTFLRPNSFMQNFITYFPPRNGAIYLPWGNGTASFVDTRNIASVAAKVLTSTGHEGKVYTLTGPAALGIAEVARILSEVAKREIKYVDVPESAARDGMLQAGLPKWQVEALMELHAINKQNRWNAVTSDIEKVTGAPPSDFAQFARDHAEKFQAS